MFEFKIWKKPMLVLKQMIHQQKVLDLSFIWHPESGHGIIMRLPGPPALKEVKNPSRPPMLFAASRRGVLLMMPIPLLGCQIKAEIKGFLLMYCLFLYYQWFFQNIEKG